LVGSQNSVEQYGFTSFTAVISGETPSGYNGTFTITTTSPTTFTYPVTCPGTSGGTGTVQTEDPAIGDNACSAVSLIPELP
jgi:hypothetical protein